MKKLFIAMCALISTGGRIHAMNADFLADRNNIPKKNGGWQNIWLDNKETYQVIANRYQQEDDSWKCSRASMNFDLCKIKFDVYEINYTFYYLSSSGWVQKDRSVSLITKMRLANDLRKILEEFKQNELPAILAQARNQED